MTQWLVAAVTVGLLAFIAPASAQSPARSTQAAVAAPDLTTGQSSARARKTRGLASRPREAPAPPRDLPPGYHKVDHQTGLPNPSIPSVEPRR